jgi:hypothetical protein
MSTDFTWFDSSEGVRPDYRAMNGRKAPPRGGTVDGEPSSSPSGAPAARPTRLNPPAASRGPAASYPIVAQYELDDPVRRGMLGFGKRREPSDIPKIKPHEVLVWRMGGRYIIDQRELKVHHDIVVRASSVSVVSVRPDTQVEVSFTIDSEDGLEFTVKVTFICSVVDPVVVVRDGQVHAADALLAYLRGYQDLFNLGLGYPIKKINKVRTRMAAEVKSYMTLRPPKIPGMEVTSATVQIETPAVVADIGNLTNGQRIELIEQDHAARLDSMKRDHIRDEASKLDEVSSNPVTARNVAFVDGGMTSSDWADRSYQDRESRQLRDRMDKMAAIARDHEVRMAELQWQHAQDEANRKEQLEARQAQVNANIELLKMYADRGYLDTHNADIEDLIRRVHGDHPGAQLTVEDRPELTDGQAPEARAPEAGHDH